MVMAVATPPTWLPQLEMEGIPLRFEACWFGYQVAQTWPLVPTAPESEGAQQGLAAHTAVVQGRIDFQQPIQVALLLNLFEDS
jgi:hypothetical protein